MLLLLPLASISPNVKHYFLVFMYMVVVVWGLTLIAQPGDVSFHLHTHTLARR
jgi:hypothetical protein